MSINIKKYTKDQMAKMVEDAVERCESLKSENADLIEKVKKEMAEKIALRNDLMAMTHSHENLKAKNVVLTEQISQMNGEAINRANEIANLKADADALRNKLADTEAALGRANACIATMQVEKDQQTKEIFEWQGSAQALHDDLLDARDRANYAEAHPWRNLWAWVKRKLVRHE
jgi:chromosome segregation ATPase